MRELVGKISKQIQAFLAVVGIAVSTSHVVAEPPAAEALEFFEKNIRPILAETCYECHGSDKTEGELRLDSKAAFEKGGASGTLLNHENPAASRLISVVEYTGEIKMPEDMKLADEDIEAIRTWVLMGAPWPEDNVTLPGEINELDFPTFIAKTRREHWAFQPVRKPEPAKVADPDWVRNPIDSFVRARLDAASLMPSPEADRRTSIRRLAFDLTGLPPTADEVQAFVEDDSSDAYEKLVDRVLASPHYGERWARHWLDVARYADTKGYVFEEDRFYPYSYTYRDYVIRAFNEDLPYNQFIIEQLAADQLDLSEDKRPLAAMGYLTLGRRYLNNVHDVTDDRIDVVTRGFLGLTVTCARCHDHKYDPIPAADYYSLYGVFRSSHEPGEKPLIEEPDPDDPHYQEFLKILNERKQVLVDYQVDQHMAMLLETRNKMGAYWLGAYKAFDIDDQTAFKTLAKEQGVRHPLMQRWKDFLKAKIATPDAIFRPYAWFLAIPEETFAEAAVAVNDRIKAATEGAEVVNPHLRNAFAGDPPATMLEVVQRYISVLENIDKQWRDQLAVRSQMVAQNPSAVPAPPVNLDDADAEAIRFLIYGTDSPANVPAGDVYGIADTPVQQKVRALRRNIASHEATHDGRPDRAPVLLDSAKPFDPYVFLRGKSGNRGDAVDRRFLQVLSAEDAKPFANGSGRLELAQAIADPENPLTARVFVNRVWLHHFGNALVDTPSDFGLRSEPPTHPELLDYLAAYFVENNWSVKQLHRLIVTSNTYRQESIDRPEGVENDIENRLLWRQNRRRLDFESMRDALLAASGELDLTLGGPPRDLVKEPFMKRRTVYGLVERQNMAGFIRTFDFASPDTHSPKRFKTVVPQQALFLMNSPFVVEQAQALAARATATGAENAESQIRELFRLSYQREPTDDEVATMQAFVGRTDFDDGPEPPPPSAWKYGYGYFNTETGFVESFSAVDVYKKGRWQPRDVYPDAELGHIGITRTGGHPGNDAQHAAIRRWVATRDGVISISGKLKHPGDKGDGLLGYIVSSRDGLAAQYTVFNGEEETTLNEVPVQAGDAIDFVAAPNTGPGFDSFNWETTITMARPGDAEGESIRTKWIAKSDFAGPPPEPPAPLTPWEQLAQVLLLTNEFMYVD